MTITSFEKLDDKNNNNNIDDISIDEVKRSTLIPSPNTNSQNVKQDSHGLFGSNMLISTDSFQKSSEGPLGQRSSLPLIISPVCSLL